jgi:phosphoserine phosphatase
MPHAPRAAAPIAPTRAVVFDADSTLVGVEGIDWLAELRTPDVAERIAELTAESMAGRVPLEEVYAARLAAVAPTRGEVEELAQEYVSALAPGAERCVSALRAAGIRPLIVSGGLLPALLPLAERLGIAPPDVHGVGIWFGADGAYLEFDRGSPLTTQHGKAALVAGLGLPRSIVAVGDGSTDLAIRTSGAADLFVAFTGFARRDAVVRGADLEVDSFDALHDLLLPRP